MYLSLHMCFHNLAFLNIYIYSLESSRSKLGMRIGHEEPGPVH